MTRWTPLGNVTEFRRPGRKLLDWQGERIAIFRTADDQWFAIDNHCTHRGGPVAAGEWEGKCLTCPWHGRQFDLSSGQPLTDGLAAIRTFPVRIRDDRVEVELITSTSSPPVDGIHRYLVRYGCTAQIGVFGTIHIADAQRGERVVLQTTRGSELGEILQTSRDSELPARPTGELLRRAGEQDEARGRAHREQAHASLSEIQNLLVERGVMVQLIDAERLLDGESLVYYYLGPSSTGLGPLAVELGERLQQRVRFQQLELEP